MKLMIDAEFKSLIPSLSNEEYPQLEKNILREGCRDAIVVWDGIILDGHNRYEICKKYELPFDIEEAEGIESRDDAIEWIIKNQFGRRNLPYYQRSKLALKLEGIISNRAKKNQGARTDISQISVESLDTQKELARIAGVSHDTISKVKIIEQEASNEIKEQLAKGEISINKAFSRIKELEIMVEELRNKSPKLEIREIEKVPSDYIEMKKKMERLERDLLNKDHDLEVARAQSTLLEKKAQLNEKEAKQYQELKTQINQLTKQKDDLGRQIQARTELSGLMVRVEHLLKTELAPIKYCRAIDEAADDEIVIRNLASIVDRVSQWCQEIEKYIPSRRNFVEIIDSEVVYSD